MKGAVEGSAAAEMLAVCNAVYIALASKLVQHGDHILLQTDCVAAIDAFENRRTTRKPDEIKALQYLRKVKKDNGLRMSFKHVKGHTTRTEARFVTNNMCDRRAKDGMRQARATMKGDTK